VSGIMPEGSGPETFEIAAHANFGCAVVQVSFVAFDPCADELGDIVLHHIAGGQRVVAARVIGLTAKILVHTASHTCKARTIKWVCRAIPVGSE